MHKRGVNLSLLWHEYKRDNPDGVQYTQFCERYRKYIGQRTTTMHIPRKAGEELFIDWAGDTMCIVDRQTGERQEVPMFVTALGASGYPYAEAFPSKEKECFMAGHVNALRYYGAVPLMLVPDNDKSGVTKASYYEPTINRTYQELAEHYGVAVVPARVRKPKDKAPVEGTVGDIQTWIIAALRNETFFSLAELNTAILQKLKEYAEKPFQKRSGSRRSIFEEYDLPAMRPLPSEPYEYAQWQVKAMVHPDCHAQINKHYYSVPHAFVGEAVDARLTANTVEIFRKRVRVCTHKRSFDTSYRYTTDLSHLPQNQQMQLSMSKEHFQEWAKTIGQNTALMVERIFERVKVEQLGYRSCLGLRRIAKNYDHDRLENACKLALSCQNYGSSYVEQILKSGLDLKKPEKSAAIIRHSNIRGPQYYGREVNV
jgi:transposase